MKNTEKTSRRSFLKQSSVAVAAAASSSLFTGLLSTSRAEPFQTNPCENGYKIIWSGSGSGFQNEEGALYEAYASKVEESYFTTKRWIYSCPNFPQQMVDTRSHGIKQDPDGTWSFNWSGSLTLVWC